MDTSYNREEGEISDDDDVIITQVTRVKHHGLKPGSSAAQSGNNDVKRLVKASGRNQTVHDVTGTLSSGHKGLILSKLENQVNIQSTSKINDPGFVSNETLTTDHGRNIMFNSGLTPKNSPTKISVNSVLPTTPETSNASSGFMERMRKRGTPIFSPSFTYNPSYLPSLPNDDVTSLMHTIDVASIPTPPPPPLPKTPPPSIPLPPPENAKEQTEHENKPEDIDDEFVDTLLEEATKQIAQDLSDMQDKTEVVDMDLESSDGEILDDSDSKIVLSNPQNDDDDEDLDVLELRLAALASYAKSTRLSTPEKCCPCVQGFRQRLEEKKVEPSERDHGPGFCDTHEQSRYRQDYPDYIPSHRKDLLERKRKRSGDSDFLRKRYEEERTEREKRKRTEEKLRREEQKRYRFEEAYRRERSLREEERKERRRLQQVEQKLHELQNVMNPENMLQKMLEIAGLGSKREQSNFLALLSKPDSSHDNAGSGDAETTQITEKDALRSEEMDVNTSPFITKEALLSWVTMNCEPSENYVTERPHLWERLCDDFDIRPGEKVCVFQWFGIILKDLGWNCRRTKHGSVKKYIGVKLIERDNDSLPDSLNDKENDLVPSNETQERNGQLSDQEVPTNVNACEPNRSQEFSLEDDMNSVAMDIDSDFVEEKSIDGNDFANFEGDIFEKSMENETPQHTPEKEKDAKIFPKAVRQQRDEIPGDQTISIDKQSDVIVGENIPNVTDSAELEGNDKRADTNAVENNSRIPFIDDDTSVSVDAKNVSETTDYSMQGITHENEDFTSFVESRSTKVNESIPFIGEDILAINPVSDKVVNETEHDTLSLESHCKMSVEITQEQRTVDQVEDGGASSKTSDLQTEEIFDKAKEYSNAQTCEQCMIASDDINSSNPQQFSVEESTDPSGNLSDDLSENNQKAKCVHALRRLRELRRSLSKEDSVSETTSQTASKLSGDDETALKWIPAFGSENQMTVVEDTEAKEGKEAAGNASEVGSTANPSSLDGSCVTITASNAPELTVQPPVCDDDSRESGECEPENESTNNEERDDDNEALLRAELLAAVARKRREKLDASLKSSAEAKEKSTESKARSEKSRESTRHRSATSRNSKTKGPRVWEPANSESKSSGESKGKVKSHVGNSKPNESVRMTRSSSRKDKENREREPTNQDSRTNRDRDQPTRQRAKSSVDRSKKSNERDSKREKENEVSKGGTKRKRKESEKKGDESDEDESLLRAQLLASVARKRREKYEAEIVKRDAEIKAMAEMAEKVRKSPKSADNAKDLKSDNNDIIGASEVPEVEKFENDTSSACGQVESRSFDSENNLNNNVESEKVPENDLKATETAVSSGNISVAAERTDSPHRTVQQDPMLIEFEKNRNKYTNTGDEKVVLKPVIAPPAPNQIRVVALDRQSSQDSTSNMGSSETGVPGIPGSIQNAEIPVPRPTESGYLTGFGGVPGVFAGVSTGFIPQPPETFPIECPVPETTNFIPGAGPVHGVTNCVPGMAPNVQPILPGELHSYPHMGQIQGFETSMIPAPGAFPVHGPLPQFAPPVPNLFPLHGPSEQHSLPSNQIPAPGAMSGLNETIASEIRTVSMHHHIPNENLVTASLPSPNERVVSINEKNISTQSNERTVEFVHTIPTLSSREAVQGSRTVEIIRVKKNQGKEEVSVFAQENEEIDDETPTGQLENVQFTVEFKSKNQRKRERRKMRLKDREETLKKTKITPAPPVYSMPKVKPVVINLQEDSSDDEHEYQPAKKPSRSMGLLSSLDSFLKDVRASVEQKQIKPPPTTPEALKNLGSKHVEEYKKLKEEIRKREEKLKAKQAAKQTTEQVVDQKAEEAKNVHKLELRVTLQKKMMEQDEQHLATLKSLVVKKKKVVSLAEQKIKQLEEQLQATRRIHESNIEQIDTLNAKCETCEKQIGTRLEKLTDLERQMLDLGRKRFGSSYVPFLQSNPHLFSAKAFASPARGSPKNQEIPKSNSMTNLQQISSNILSAKPDNTENKTAQAKERSEKEKKLASEEEQERIQLEKLHKQYAELIKRYKEQMKLKSQTAPAPEHIETEETMQVSAVLDSSEEGVDVNLKRRRRSILDGSHGSLTKPNLAITLSPKKEALGRKMAKGLGGKPEGEYSPRESSPLPSSVPAAEFKMPTGQHSTNLCKLHKENLQKEAWFSKSLTSVLPSHNILSCDKSISVISGAKYKPMLSSKHKPVDNDLPKLKSYSSSLLRFKSYRFNPYYRTKAHLNLTSLTFSNKVDAKRMFCQFDLTGICNDEKCPWQHQKDLKMTSEEILQDLASYAPAAIGISADQSTEAYPNEIKNFVTKFGLQNPVPDSQQCILLVSHINESTKHVPPHTTFVEPRVWRPALKLQEDKSDKESVYSVLFDKGTEERESGKIFEDDILSEEDVRYWMLGSEDVQDMESGLLEDKHNIHLWLKLAYKKLHDQKLSQNSNLDQALNVMSRALEANRNSDELWLHYLGMFSRRKDKSDLMLLCKQALQYAPSYELHWEYLSVLPTISQKRMHCRKVEDFLMSPECAESEELKSHHLLEILFYCVQLCVLSGRTSSALQIMQEKYKGGLENILALSDYVLFAMCYVHMLEYRCLPTTLCDSSSSAPGRIVNKQPFVIAWKCKGDKHTTAIEELIDRSNKHTQAKDNTETLVPLYRTLLQYYVLSGREERFWKVDTEALSLLKLTLEVSSQINNNETTLQKYKEALKQAKPHDVQLAYKAVQFMLSVNKTDDALECLELVPAKFFVINEGEAWDPNQLFCKLLGQSLPLNCKLPQRNIDITVEEIKAQLKYLWACYGLILELQGFQSEVSECYESAIASLVDVNDLRFIWTCYLKHSHKELSELSRTTEPRKASHIQQMSNKFQQFTSLVKRCLVSMPTKFPLPHNPDSYWLDYSFHCDVIDMYVACLGADDRVTAYEEFVKMMPDNVLLIIRACRCFFEYGAKTLALGTSRVALEDHKQSLPLWKLHLMVAGELCSPKEYLLLEATCGKEENVKQILQKCKDLELNLGDFVATVLK